jgi:hypothetical protein
MKIIKYTLNENGTIPDYIIDGGYFSVQNDLPQPQDFDLVGVASDDAPQQEFLNKNELLEYITNKNLSFKNTITGEDISLETMCDYVWNKLEI